MSRRSVSALVRLPLWAIAIGPRAVLAVIGWAFLRLELPAVEYRTWPLLRRPGRRRRRSGLNTSATHAIAAPGGPDPPPRDGRLRHQSLELAHPRRLHCNYRARRSLAEQHLVGTPGRVERGLAANRLAA